MNSLLDGSDNGCPSKMDIAGCLEKAASRLDKPYSWCRNALFLDHPGAPDRLQACAVGTLRHAASRSNFSVLLSSPAVLAVGRYLAIRAGCTGLADVAYWNDTTASNKEEVAKLFRDVACALRIEAEQDELVTAGSEPPLAACP